MTWNDIEILKLIDMCAETENGSLISGFALLNRAAPGQSMDANRDYPAFAHELLAARDAGLITFDDATGYMQPRPDPQRDPHLWLQHIQDIRLTFAGRNWARGRVLALDWPEPGEDDGRMVTGLTLGAIASEIARVLLAEQLRQFLQESGIPEEYLAPTAAGQTGSEYVRTVLAGLLSGGSAARRAFRVFVGRWLIGELHFGPDVASGTAIRILLGKQGWHEQSGRLVVGEVVRLDEAADREHSRRILGLHPEVRRAAGALFAERQTGLAVHDAFAAVVGRIRRLTGLPSPPVEMVRAALGGPDPRIRLAAAGTAEGRARQQGLCELFTGAAAGLSDVEPRTWYGSSDEVDALDQLGFASSLMRLLDEAGVTPRQEVARATPSDSDTRRTDGSESAP